MTMTACILLHMRIMLSLIAALLIVAVFMLGWGVLPIVGVASGLAMILGVQARWREQISKCLYSVLVGAISGMVTASLFNSVDLSVFEGALSGATAAEVTWIVLNMGTATSALRRVRSNATRRPSGQRHHMLRYLLITACVLLASLTVSAGLWAVFMRGRWAAFHLDWSFYLVRFLAIGCIVGMLAGIPFLLAAFGIVSDTTEPAGDTTRKE